MTSIGEIHAEMDGLEEEARAILANPNVTPLERRQALAALFHRHQVLEEYLAALASFIRRMRAEPQDRTLDPEEVVREILASPEFAALRLLVLAVLIAAVYGDGPRSAWVPMALLPMMPIPLPGLRL
ncbi:MAG: hypothetical protein F8N37_08910 [Telmatospirillum sp.]|nr:hypothetical protein [Telmatospirillum sp.]